MVFVCMFQVRGLIDVNSALPHLPILVVLLLIESCTPITSLLYVTYAVLPSSQLITCVFIPVSTVGKDHTSVIFALRAFHGIVV